MVTAAPVIEQASETRLAPRWQVVLLNDDDHTYDYVVEMLVEIFQITAERAFQHAREVDRSGRTVVDITTRERAELKQEQIHAYGPDWRIERCAGAMSAEIEPLDA